MEAHNLVLPSPHLRRFQINMQEQHLFQISIGPWSLRIDYNMDYMFSQVITKTYFQLDMVQEM